MFRLIVVIAALGCLDAAYGVCAGDRKLPWDFSSGMLGTTCFALSRDAMSYNEAEKACTASGGHLASIHSEETNRFLVELMRKANLKGKAWIGFHDKMIENQFEWTDGSMSDFNKWAKDNGPRSGFRHSFEDCATLDSDDQMWHDTICTEGIISITKRFLCGYAPATVEATTESSP